MGRQLVRRPLVIKPTPAFHLIHPLPESYRTRRLQAGQRIIMRCPADSFSLSADPIAPMEDGRLFTRQPKIDLHTVFPGCELKIMRTDQAAFPIANPCQPLPGLKPRLAKTPPRQSLEMMKLRTPEIAHGKMRELHVPLPKRGSRSRFPRRNHPLAEKCKLITKFPPIRVRHVSSEIPPLGFKPRMAPVIPRKFISPSG